MKERTSETKHSFQLFALVEIDDRRDLGDLQLCRSSRREVSPHLANNDFPIEVRGDRDHNLFESFTRRAGRSPDIQDEWKLTLEHQLLEVAVVDVNGVNLGSKKLLKNHLQTFTRSTFQGNPNRSMTNTVFLLQRKPRLFTPILHHSFLTELPPGIAISSTARYTLRRVYA